MGEVSVEGAAEGKLSGVVCDGAIDRAVTAGNVLVREACEKLLLVAKALGAAGGRAEAVIVVVFDVEGLLEATPFILGEEVAEVRLTEVASFVCADGLHGVGVVVCESETFGRELVHAFRGVTDVEWDILEEKIKVTQIRALQVVFEAAVIRCQGVVLCTAFRDDDDVEEGVVGECTKLRVWRLLKGRAKEA